MNDPHSHAHTGGCGCSAKSAEPAAAPASCCSGASTASVPVEQAGKMGGCCSGPKVPGDATKATDPVCGMTVDPAKTAHHAEHAGHEYHFCSAGCRTKFVAESMPGPAI